MKIALLQPPYPSEGTRRASQACFDWIISRLTEMGDGCCDLIALPEYANAPGLSDPDEQKAFAGEHTDALNSAIHSTCQRVGCAVAVGMLVNDAERWVNMLECIGPHGKPFYTYRKVHLTDYELDTMRVFPGDTIDTVEYDGVRWGAAICFDAYFPEHFERLAARGVDIILAPSYQRSEIGDRIIALSKTRAFDSGAFLVRSSYAMPNTAFGGHSLVADPCGEIVLDAGTAPGVFYCEIDPEKSCMRPASFGRSEVSHRALIERHRRPELYRRTGNKYDALSFPRICAHRGWSAACPENTIPAFTAAMGMGVEEIEFDLYPTRDGEIVVCHDADVDRTTNGHGRITELDWDDIRALDAGIGFGAVWEGVRIPRFVEVLDHVDDRTVLNIHVKAMGEDGAALRHICDLIRDRDYSSRVYIAAETTDLLQAAKEYAPDIPRACLARADAPAVQIELARTFECERIQFGRNVTPDAIDTARKNGLICNLFWSDDPSEARDYFDAGIDVVLTNKANLFQYGDQ